MAKTARSYIDVSRKSQVEIIKPSRKSQERARTRVKYEFQTVNIESTTRKGVVVVVTGREKCESGVPLKK